MEMNKDNNSSAELSRSIPDGWSETTLGEFTLINPTERLPKGTITTRVAMDALQTFTRKINNHTVDEFKGGVKFRNGDTLMARITPSLENGKTSFVDVLEKDKIGFGSTEFLVFREKDSVSDKYYIFYLLISPRIRDIAIKSMTGTSGRQRVQTNVLENHRIILPPLQEQKAIAKVLTAFDDKIELLQEQNKTLENTAQTIFKEWFGKYQVGDELPEGWRVGTYDNLVKLSSGKGVKKKEYVEDGKYEIIGANGSLGRLDNFLIDEQIIITGRVGTLGTVFIINKPVWISDNVLVSKPKKLSSFYYSYFTLKGFNFKSLNTGSTQPLITQSDLKSVEVMLPNEDILDSFNSLCSRIFLKIETNTIQIQSLTKTRDTLLPKLMSGEIRVKM